MLEEVIIFLLLYAVLVFTDIVPVFKEKKIKSIIICTSIFTIAFVLQFLIIFGVKLPRYGDVIENAIRSIGLPGV